MCSSDLEWGGDWRRQFTVDTINARPGNELKYHNDRLATHYLRVGYTRAGRLIDMLERRGAISGYEGSKPRQVLISEADIPRIMGGAPAADDAE